MTLRIRLSGRSDQLVVDQIGKLGKGHDLLLGQVAGFGVNDAQRADSLAVCRMNWVASVEPDVWFAGDERVVGKALVCMSIRHDQRFFVEQGVPTEGDAALCFRCLQPDS